MLKAIIDKLEDVPEALREFYAERNGKFELKVEGMKTQADVDRVQSALTKEKADHVTTKTELKTVKDKVAEFGELDPHEVATKLAELETIKAVGGDKPDQAKIDTLVNQRVETEVKRKTAPMERELKTVKEQLAEANTKVTTLDGTLKGKTKADAIRAEAIAQKVSPEAINDLITLADKDFDLSEDGKVTSKDGLDVKTWLSDQKKARPYLWAPATGAGANGNNGDVNGGKNPFAHATWNMTEQGKLLTTDRATAERLATAAGTTIGGGKPPAPEAKTAA